MKSTASAKCTGMILAMCLAFGPVAFADDSEAAAPAAAKPASTTASSEEVTRLKAQLAEQQRQLEQLKASMEAQQKLLQALASKSEPAAPAAAAAATPMTPTQARVSGIGMVASTTAMVPPAPPVAAPQPAAQPAKKPSNPCEAPPDANAVPAFLRLGSTCVIPVGFMDLTAVWRDKNAGSSLGSNFGSVPYNNTTNAKNSEFRFTPQNSRIGFRVDGQWKDVHFIGYNEFDFLGTGGGTNYTVTNGAFVPRLRLFWVDVRKGAIEFLAGQSWSMLTPNRKGISALPGDLFYSQVIDVNYMAGLTWTRQPGMRVIFHPNDKVTAGVSFENPDQYIGGSAGGSGITLPGALTALGSAQLDNAPNIGTANTVLSVPTVHPDIIAKIAFDPSSKFHMDIAAIERTFKVWNPNTAPALGAGQHFSKVGGGVQLGLNAEIVKNFRLISTNYWSSGGGRYLFGQAPDVIVRSDGSLSTVRAGGTVDGFEATVKNFLLYAYYGGIYIARNQALDANGTTKIGYGFTGAPNSQNRAINEVTLGFNQTIWKNPRYGAINAMGQYEWLSRNPWFVATGAPKATHDSTIYFNLRYTLPGGMPSF